MIIVLEAKIRRERDWISLNGMRIGERREKVMRRIKDEPF